MLVTSPPSTFALVLERMETARQAERRDWDGNLKPMQNIGDCPIPSSEATGKEKYKFCEKKVIEKMKIEGPWLCALQPPSRQAGCRGVSGRARGAVTTTNLLSLE